MLTDRELIRKLDFFEPLDEKIIKNIARLCIVREFSAGEAIVRQGESGLGLYFITGGRAKVEVDKEGSKVVVAELREGDFLGEFSIIDDKTRSASVICLQDTRCLLLTRDSFSRLLKKYPEIAAQMLRTLVARIRNTNERMSQPTGSPPPPTSAPPVPVVEPAQENGAGGLAGATRQMATMIPKPEEMVQFYTSTKGKTQDFLNRFVSTIYAMKAMLRFSMAIVGCPVTVTAENPHEEILQATLNDVKLILFPAASEQTIRIEAFADGTISATLYRAAGPEGPPKAEIFRLRGPLRQGEFVRLHVAAGHPIRMEQFGALPRVVAPRVSPVPELVGPAVPEAGLIAESLWQ